MARSYRAFVSYSHRDERIARRLHRRIEGYQPPRRLAEGAPAPPRRIAPVFRDRDELATSDDLPARIREALEASENLVVLCSSAAAASRWVNREIEEFAARRGPAAIHAVIVGGRAPEAFPPALRALSAEPLAADLTEAGDGFEDGALKLIAGLLPAPYGEVKNREVARARARAWRNGILAAVFALLALVAGGAAWRAVEETRAREAELGRAEAAILAAVEGIERIVEQVAAGAERGDVPVALAATLLAAAERMAENVVALAPENARLSQEYGDLLIQLSRHHRRAGDLAKAAEAANRAEAVFARGAAASDDALEGSARARIERGDAAMEAARPGDALLHFFAALADARLLLERAPARDDRLREVSVALERTGDAQAAVGYRDAAFASYSEALGLRLDLLARLPGDATRMRDLAVAHQRIGQMRYEDGEAGAALASFDEALALSRELFARDPDLAERARDVAAALDRVGAARLALGEIGAAIAAFEEAVGIGRKAVTRDAANAIWARDLAVSLGRYGDALEAAGDSAGAAGAHRESLAIRRELAGRDPSNAARVRELWVGIWRVARLSPEEAAALMTEVVEIMEREAAAGRLPPRDEWSLAAARAQLAAARAR